MQLKINSKDFFNGLRQVSSAIKENPIIPIMKSVLIEANGGLLRITGTSEELTIVHEIVIDDRSEVRFLLPYAESSKIFGAISNECIISIYEDRIDLFSGHESYQLGKPDDARLYPITPERGRGISIEVDGDFFYSLKLASTRTYKMVNNMVDLCNVFIDISESSIIVFACNQVAAFIKTIPAKGEKRQIAVLPELLKPLFTFQDSELFIDDKRLYVTHNRTSIIIRLSEVRQINVMEYKSLIKDSNFKISPELLSEALNKVLVYNDAAPVVDLLFKEGVLRFSYEDNFLNNKAYSSIEISGTDNRKAILNGALLSQMISVFGHETKELDISVSTGRENISISSKEENIITFISPLIFQ